MKRRSFLKAVGGAVGAGALNVGRVGRPQEAAVQEAPAQATGLPRRLLGRTGERISIVGFPGLALAREEQERCTAAIHDAFGRGVNYYDVAPAYGRDGISEIRMGIGLQGIDRSKIFLACKTKMRDKEGARQELERSLERLKTDRFDLYQMHALITVEEVQQAFAPGGAMETFLQAKQQGKVRFLGFSAHTTAAALEALKHYSFDTVMFPINFIEYFTFDFGKQVLDRAKKHGAAVLAIKPMCRGEWPEGVENTRKWWYRPVEDEKEIDLALRFTLSQQPVAAGLPPAFLDLLDKAITAAAAYKPITDAETEQLGQLAASCLSLFRSRQEPTAADSKGSSWYAHNPHEGCPGAFA